MKEALANLSRSDVRTPFLLIIINFGLVNFSGPPIMVFYAVEILQSDTVNKGETSASVLLIGETPVSYNYDL